MLNNRTKDGYVTAVHADDPAIRKLLNGIVHVAETRDFDVMVRGAMICEAIIGEIITGCENASALSMAAWAARDRIQALPQQLQDFVCQALNDRMERLQGNAA